MLSDTKNERVSEYNDLSWDGRHRGPYNSYKPFNHNLHIGIIIILRVCKISSLHATMQNINFNYISTSQIHKLFLITCQWGTGYTRGVTTRVPHNMIHIACDQEHYTQTTTTIDTITTTTTTTTTTGAAAAGWSKPNIALLCMILDYILRSDGKNVCVLIDLIWELLVHHSLMLSHFAGSSVSISIIVTKISALRCTG